MTQNTTIVATVLTVYGIETKQNGLNYAEVVFPLQQYLPFTVLKLYCINSRSNISILLQQYLPFTVLKLSNE